MLNKKVITNLFTLFILLILSTAAHALPFTIITTPGTTLPTSILTGETLTASYTVSNNTGSYRANNYVQYLPLNVTQVQTGGAGTCGTTFNLSAAGQAGSSCILHLNITGPVNAEDPDQTHQLFVCFPGGKTCNGTNERLSVTQSPGVSAIAITPVNATIFDNGTQQYSAAITLTDGTNSNGTNLVTWASSNHTAATISSSGLAQGITGGQTTNITASFKGITSNTAKLNVAKRVVSIAITPTSPIIRVGISTQFNAIATYDDGSTANVTPTASWTSSNSAITITPTGVATGVTLAGSSNITAAINSVTSNSVSATVVRFAYIGASPITYCQISTSGIFSNCITNTIGASANTLAVSTAGTFLYIYTGTLSFCPISADGSLSTACTNTSFQPGSETRPTTTTAVHPNGTQIYLAGGNGVYVCPLNPATGNTTAACSFMSISGANFLTMSAVAPNGKFLFMADQTGTTVQDCPLNPDGTIVSCSGTGGYPNAESFGGIGVNPSSNILYGFYNKSGGGAVAAITGCPYDQTTGSLNCPGSVGITVARNSIGPLEVDPLGTFAYWTDLAFGSSYSSVSNQTFGSQNSTSGINFSYQITIR